MNICLVFLCSSQVFSLRVSHEVQTHGPEKLPPQTSQGKSFAKIDYSGYSTSAKYDYSNHVQYGEAPMVWQRPRGEIKGIFLYLHGCGGRATDGVNKTNSKGVVFKGCEHPCSDSLSAGARDGSCCPARGLESEFLMREKALDRGYLVLGLQGGFDKPERCWDRFDVETGRVARSLKKVKRLENVTDDKPVFVAGFSSGAEVATLVTAAVQAKCTVMVAAVSRRAGKEFNELAIPDDYPNAPIMMIHHDESESQKQYSDSMTLARTKHLKAAEISVNWAGHPHHNYLGAYTNEAIDFCETGKQPEVKNFDH